MPASLKLSHGPVPSQLMRYMRYPVYFPSIPASGCRFAGGAIGSSFAAICSSAYCAVYGMLPSLAQRSTVRNPTPRRSATSACFMPVAAMSLRTFAADGSCLLESGFIIVFVHTRTRAR